MLDVRAAARASPLAGLPGAARLDAVGVAVAERGPLDIVGVAALDRVGSVAGLLGGLIDGEVALTAGSVQAGNGLQILWGGPGRWLVVRPASADRPLAVVLEERLGSAAAVVDLGHARTVLRMAGPESRVVLTKGCGLDLAPRAFPPGTCAHTGLAHMPALIHAVDATPAFDLYLHRSYAESFWHWLVAATAEFSAGA